MALRLLQGGAPAAPVTDLRVAVVETDREGGSYTLSMLDGFAIVREAHLNNVTREQADAVADLLISFGA